MGLDDSLACLDPQTGEALWQVKLPYDGAAGKQRASMVGGQIFVDNADDVTLQFGRNGQLIWTSKTPDAAIPLPCWSDERSLVCFARDHLVRYEHGVEQALPTEAGARKDLASELVAQFAALDAAGRRRLQDLGPDAFAPTLAAYVIAASGEDSASRARRSGLFSILDKVSRSEDSTELRRVLSEVPVAPSDIRELIKILIRVGDPKDNVPFFIAEYERIKKLEERVPYIGFAVEYLAESSEPEAVAYMLKQLDDPKSDIQPLAYYNLAGTGGEEGVKAVLAERRTRQLLKPLAERVLPGLVDSGEFATKAKPLRQKTDSAGRTWGIMQSGIIGHSGDLWLVEKTEGEWRNPVFTGLSTGGALDPFDGGKADTETQELLDGPWLETLVGNRDILRDEDRDGLSDLVEERLGTDPSKVDTDGDGDSDEVDPWPNAPNRDDLSEAEQVLAAAFEARFHFSWSQGTAILLGQPGMRPFEMTGGPGVVIWVEERDKANPTPLEACFPHGVGFLGLGRSWLNSGRKDENESGTGAEAIIEWNQDRTEARVEVSATYGGLNGTGYEAVVRKIGTQWLVVSLKMTWVS